MATGEVTQLLLRASQGDKRAEEEVLTQVYHELRRIASGYFRHENPDHTLQTTALVHEAYLRLTGNTEIDWQSRSHFFSVAARTMRWILVDHARKKRSEKRGGGGIHVPLDENLQLTDEQCDQFPELDAALVRLQALRPRWAEVVELRYFGGLTEQEIADMRNVSVKTVKRDWEKARAWLHDELSH